MSAERLSVLILQLDAKLHESIAFVRDVDTKENFEQYRRVENQRMTTGSKGKRK